MKYWLIIYLLVGFLPYSIAADKPLPPNGHQILQIFFENINKPLKNEPFCQMRYRTSFWGELEGIIDENDPRYLKQTLAEHISASLGEQTNIQEDDPDPVWTSLLTQCDPELYDETPEEIKIPHWVCRVTFRLHNRENPWIGQVNIMFFVKSDLSEIISGSIRCLD